MRPGMLQIGSASVLLIPALLGLALLSGCGGDGGGASPAEIQEQNVQGEADAANQAPAPGA